VLAGDVASGKSALALGIGSAPRWPESTVYLSGEMSPERVMERALALEGKAAIDDLRRAGSIRRPSGGRAAATNFATRHCCFGRCSAKIFDEVRLGGWSRYPGAGLLVMDSLQLAPVAPPRRTARQRIALAVRALKDWRWR